MMIFASPSRYLSLGVTLFALACASNDKPNQSQTEPPSIAGSYQDDYGTSHQITATTWTMGASVFRIVQVDNPHSFLIAQNDSGNKYNPGAWSRFDWTYDDSDVLWYCQTAYAAESQEAAQQTAAADASNLAAGCSGFAWSRLTAGSSDAGSN